MVSIIRGQYTREDDEEKKIALLNMLVILPYSNTHTHSRLVRRSMTQKLIACNDKPNGNR